MTFLRTLKDKGGDKGDERRIGVLVSQIDDGHRPYPSFLQNSHQRTAALSTATKVSLPLSLDETRGSERPSGRRSARKRPRSTRARAVCSRSRVFMSRDLVQPRESFSVELDQRSILIQPASGAVPTRVWLGSKHCLDNGAAVPHARRKSAFRCTRLSDRFTLGSELVF